MEITDQNLHIHSNALLIAALDYSARGWPVFPVHTARNGKCSCGRMDCKNVAKHPRTSHGFHDANTDPAVVEGYWTQWPDANIGIRTGMEAGIIVIDVDPRHGGEETLVALQEKYGDLPKVPYSHTGGGGWHFLFKHPGTPVKSKTVAPGVDIKADGGYIIAAPSLHASGQRYRWGEKLNGTSTDDLLPLPRWLIKLLIEPEQKPDNRNTGAKNRIILAGARNTTLTSFAGTLRRRGMSKEEIFAALKAENDKHCVPPLNEYEVQKIAESISRYEPVVTSFCNNSNGTSQDTESMSSFEQRTQAIIDAKGCERDNLIRILIQDLVTSSDTLIIEGVGKALKSAKVLSITAWRQLVKEERQQEQQRRQTILKAEDQVKREIRLQELISTKSDLMAIHEKLARITSSPHSHDVIELALAASISHLLSNEVLLWLLIVGPPSSDKTQSALAFKDAPYVFHLDTLTENAFISGFVSPDGTATQDLLAELDKRCLIIKDLNALFGQHHDKVAKVLGDMTAIYDGEFAKWTGTRGNVSYASRFSLIGCVTPFTLAQHHRYMNMIGARFLSYRVAELDAAMVNDGFDTVWSGRDEFKTELRRLASAYATQLHHRLSKGDLTLPEFSENTKRVLNTLAKFLACARAAVRTERTEITTLKGKSTTVYDIIEVQREEPFRALLQLRTLALSLALVHQRSQISDHELELCRRVVLSSMPYDRSLILALFQKPACLAQGGRLTRKTAAEGISKARNQAVRLLTELESVGVLKGEKVRDIEQSVDVWSYIPTSEDFAALLTKPVQPLDHQGDLNCFNPRAAVLCNGGLTQNCDRNPEKKLIQVFN